MFILFVLVRFSSCVCVCLSVSCAFIWLNFDAGPFIETIFADYFIAVIGWKSLLLTCLNKYGWPNLLCAIILSFLPTLSLHWTFFFCCLIVSFAKMWRQFIFLDAYGKLCAFGKNKIKRLKIFIGEGVFVFFHWRFIAFRMWCKCSYSLFFS